MVLDFTEDTFDVNEGDGNVLVCMELIGLPADGLECDLVIPLIMVPGKAREYHLKAGCKFVAH